MNIGGRAWKVVPSLPMLCNQMWKPSAFIQLKTSFGVHSVEQVRNQVRKFFARPSERVRLARHGYETRMKTPSGRAIIMRRILKGRFVLSH